MHLLQRIRQLLALTGLLASLALTVPAYAGQAEIDLLASYVGNWKGEGLLVGGEEPETFRCRMTVAKGQQAKINYAGRCTLAGMNLAVSGTIAYMDDANRYEGAMTSNTAFSGVAIGKKRGSTITFDLKERSSSDQNGDMTIGSKILLKGGKITVEFEIEFSESGKTMKTSVPFSR